MSEVDEIFAALGGKPAAGGAKPKPEAGKEITKAASKKRASAEEDAADSSTKKSKKSAKQGRVDTSQAARSTHTDKDKQDDGAEAADKKVSTSAKANKEAPVGSAKPKTRVPTVVHDTSSAPRAAPQPRPKKLDDDDAAFADSRGKDRTCLAHAGARTEEGYRIFTEDELKLNKGGGACMY